LAPQSRRDLIIATSQSLFNRTGVGSTSTNHIAAAAKISPGNLYYYFSDKEEILRVLFADMTQEIEALWEAPMDQELFFRSTIEVVWQYRFFHREMYALRRLDVKLNRLWRAHMQKIQASLMERIREWSDPESDEELVEHKCFSVLAFLSAFVHVFESTLKPARKSHIEFGMQHLLKVVAAD
jgi:AcrR family transcriptional regulator